MIGQWLQATVWSIDKRLLRHKWLQATVASQMHLLNNGKADSFLFLVVLSSFGT